MDFRNKTPQFREKVRDIYSELNIDTIPFNSYLVDV